MNRLASSFVLGFHGCDEMMAQKFVNGLAMKPSTEKHDWLGTSGYFWEANPQRGIDWARQRALEARSKITNPAVVGVVIDLGLCLDLTTTDAIGELRIAHSTLQKITANAKENMPQNSGKHGLGRELDCAVINTLHDIRVKNGAESIQTVRAVFIEGNEVYPTADFLEKTHIQIAVHDVACIKGVFRVSNHHYI